MNRRRHAVFDGGRGEPPAEIRHRTITELRRTVGRHPAVETASAVRNDDGRFGDLHVELLPRVLETDADEAGIRIQWRPRRDPAEPAHFVFHYYESSGRDFGWHREPNPHVDGLAHFQHRASSDDEYTYEPVQFISDSPVALCWEILGRIEERV